LPIPKEPVRIWGLKYLSFQKKRLVTVYVGLKEVLPSAFAADMNLY
jgi:hypothetical protein